MTGIFEALFVNNKTISWAALKFATGYYAKTVNWFMRLWIAIAYYLPPRATLDRVWVRWRKTVINDSECQIIWLRIYHNRTDPLTCYFNLHLLCQYYIIYTFSFGLFKPNPQFLIFLINYIISIVWLFI